MKLINAVGLMILSVLMLCSPVFAATLTGTLGGTGVISDSYTFTTLATTPIEPIHISASPIELSIGTTTLVRFDNGRIPTFFSRTPTGDTASFTAKIGSDVIGTGTFGYMRNFDTATPTPNEIDGYQYLEFSSWNPGTYTGNQIVNLTFTGSLNGLNWTGYSNSAGGTTGRITLTYGYDFLVPSFYDIDGIYINNRVSTFSGTYTVTKPSGIGIQGSVTKGGTVGRVFIVDGVSGVQLASEETHNVNTYNINVPAETIKICVQDTLLNWINTSTLFSVPTPTPTPSPGGGYSITIVPSSISSTGSAVGTLTSTIPGSMGKVTDISWSWEDSTGTYDFYESGNISRPLDYTNYTGTWYGFDPGASSYTNLKGTIPNPVTLSNISSSGYKIVTCFIGTSDGYWYTLTSGLTVAQGGMQTLIIEATDAYSNALVSYTDISVLDKSSNLWSNVTASQGVYNFLSPYNANLYIEGTAPGYQKSTKNWTVSPYSSYILKLPMYPTGTIAASNVTLNVITLDTTMSVFPNAQVRLSDGQVKTTSGAGVASFNVSATKSYQIVASYTGYQSATRTLTTGAGGTSQDTYLTLNRIVVTTAPTLPPGVTAVVTLDTRTNAQKDQAMMDQIRDYANILIPVACLMTLLYMFGYKP